MDRMILHSDINACYASIELLRHPELRGRPVAVGGERELRHGIILAKDQMARAAGVNCSTPKNSMSLRDATRISAGCRLYRSLPVTTPGKARRASSTTSSSRPISRITRRRRTANITCADRH